MTEVILASASPSRLAVLKRAGLNPVVRISSIDEKALTADSPTQLVERLAEAKACSVLASVSDGLIIGCDSMMEFDNALCGKPASAEDARNLWRRMSGGSGVFHTGHHLIDAATRRSASAVGSTAVYFGKVTDEEIDCYVASGEPLGVAGAFKIDGRGAWFVERIEGDVGVLHGLSLPILRRLVAALDVSVPQLWCKFGRRTDRDFAPARLP